MRDTLGVEVEASRVRWRQMRIFWHADPQPVPCCLNPHAQPHTSVTLTCGQLVQHQHLEAGLLAPLEEKERSLDVLPLLRWVGPCKVM